MARYLLAQPIREEDARSGVRLAIGNGMRADVWRDFQGRFSVGRICEFYGSTEGNANLINTESVVGAVRTAGRDDGVFLRVYLCECVST